VVLDELLVGRFILIHAHAQNYTVARSDPLVEFNQSWGFFYAWWAPGRPEIQNHHFAAKVRQVRRLAVDIDRKVFRGASSDGGFALTVVWKAEKSQDGEGETHTAVGHNFAQNCFHNTGIIS